MPLHRSTIPLWIIAISLVVIVLWMIGVPRLVTATIQRAARPPLPTVSARPTADTETWTAGWSDVCAGLTYATYRPDYRYWLQRWGQFEGDTLYLIGRVVRQHAALPGTFYVDVELAGLHDIPTGRGIVWMDHLRLPDGTLLLPDTLIEVAGIATAPVIDQVAGATLPRLRVGLWRDLTSEKARCPRVAKGPPPPPQSSRYRWEN